MITQGGHPRSGGGADPLSTPFSSRSRDRPPQASGEGTFPPQFALPHRYDFPAEFAQREPVRRIARNRPLEFLVPERLVRFGHG